VLSAIADHDLRRTGRDRTNLAAIAAIILPGSAAGRALQRDPAGRGIRTGLALKQGTPGHPKAKIPPSRCLIQAAVPLVWIVPHPSGACPGRKSPGGCSLRGSPARSRIPAVHGREELPAAAPRIPRARTTASHLAIQKQDRPVDFARARGVRIPLSGRRQRRRISSSVDSGRSSSRLALHPVPGLSSRLPHCFAQPARWKAGDMIGAAAWRSNCTGAENHSCVGDRAETRPLGVVGLLLRVGLIPGKRSLERSSCLLYQHHSQTQIELGGKSMPKLPS